MRYYLAVFVILICNTLIHGQGISISPSRIFFTGEAGQTVSQAITFNNSSASTLSFVANLKDWDRDSLGSKRYYTTGNNAGSNASWLTLSENTVQLAPGETKVVNLSMTIPDHPTTKQQRHCMLFFTQVKEQKAAQANGLQMNVLIEVGIQVYHTPAGLKAGDLEFLAFEDKGAVTVQDSKTVRRMEAKVRNTGQINKDAYVRFELTNIETGEETPVEAVAIAMLPDSEQWVRVDLPGKLASGRYLAVAILDAGSQYDLKIAEKEITY
ncbi:hypothetical protein ACK8HY_13795 [Sphingobacterium sp. NGMCC 1.201703]|uniref:hypothetical protein n=1 Tax=Sphingobacterium sp. NGMCC 1.201703 TaxID=3388657 RepID=UPI0039FC9239